MGFVRERAGIALLVATAGVYLAVSLYRIEDFPAYFHGDEAVAACWARHLLHNGGRGPGGELLPAFFVSGQRYNLGNPVYLQLPLVALGLASVATVRGLSVVLSWAGALVLALGARQALKTPWWWMLPLWLLVNPVWFLHVRTGFDTPISVSFYMAFVGFGLCFLAGSRWALPAALVAAALSFYAYAPARLVAPLAVFGLWVAWLVAGRQPAVRWPAILVLCVLLAVPFVRHVVNHPQEQSGQLAMLGSFWGGGRSLGEALAQSLASYGRVWSPGFWLQPERHLVRHVVPGYGLLQPFLLPFLALGLLAVGVRAVRGPAKGPFWFLLLLLITAPAAAFLVEPGPTRQLFLVPLIALVSGFGGSLVAARIKRLGAVAWTTAVAGVLMASLALLTAKSFASHSFATHDYGLYGLQWGARQVFAEIKSVLDREKDVRVVVSPNWANNADALVCFFFGDEPRLQVASWDWFAVRMRDLKEPRLFVMTPDEYAQVRTNPKFSKPRLRTILPYPDGRPGFYFCSLSYSAEAEALIQAEIEERKKPIAAEVVVAGERWAVSHSFLDMGPVAALFDGDPKTLVRTMEANPLRLVIRFSNPKRLTGATLVIGAGATRVRLWIRNDEREQPVVEEVFPASHGNRTVELRFGPWHTAGVTVEVFNEGEGEPANVHLWELSFREEKGQASDVSLGGR